MRFNALGEALANSVNSVSAAFSAVVSPMINRLGSAPIGGAVGRDPSASVLNPPESLQSLSSRLLLFYSFCALLIGAVWFSICVSLYVVGVEYHVMNVMYESRWIPITIVFVGASAVALAVWKCETFFIGCGLSSLYSCASCLVATVVYSLDFRKALYQLHPPITSRMAGDPRRKYLQLCGCMITVSLLGLAVSVLTLFKLWQIATWYYAKFTLHRKHRGYLLMSAIFQLPLIWFSIYVTSHVISLPFSYVHQYMIQELLCALTLKAIVVIQAFHYIRGNRLTLKLLLILNGCQTIQEVFYTWNSYYISLYIHTSKAKLAVGAETDQYLMSANFVGHFARMCIAAYTTYHLSIWLRAPFMRTYCRVELSRRSRQALVLLAAVSLLLGASHVIMDVLYAVTDHIYRTLIAFTGISVFYLSLLGVCLALFVRSGHTLLLIIASVIMLLLSAVSIHAVYIYIDTSFQRALLSSLEAVGKDRRQASYMHFVEAWLAFLSLIVCLIGGVLLFRILHIDSYHDRRDGKLRRPLLILFGLGIVQLELASVNVALIVSVNDESKIFQSMLAYGVLDSISTFIMCLMQIYVCRPFNSHVSYGLTALLLFLTCESLTTYNYLSTKTTYVQLLIVFSQMFTGNQAMRQVLSSTFPADEVGLMVAAHVVQLVQWVLTVISLLIAALSLEMLYQQRAELAKLLPGPAVTTIAATEASSSGATGHTGAAYHVGKEESSNQQYMENAQKQSGAGRGKDEGEQANGAAVECHQSYDNPVYDRKEELSSAEEVTGNNGEQVAAKRDDSERGELLPQKDEAPKGNDEEDSEGKLIESEDNAGRNDEA